MNGKELNDLFKGLKEQGWNPQLCDTPIPVSLATAQCGIPTEMGDEYIDDYILLPKALVGNQPEMLIPAKGDSMRDAGYEEGDLLTRGDSPPVRLKPNQNQESKVPVPLMRRQAAWMTY